MSKTTRPVAEERVGVVRTGHGANCSSIGSVIDTLFATATVGAMVFAAVTAALAREEVRVVGGRGAEPEDNASRDGEDGRSPASPEPGRDLKEGPS
jgi:hypothetical protein